MGAIKNVGDMAIESIVQARNKDGGFTSCMDVCKRVDLRVVNKQVLESLIKSGCFDGLCDDRAKLLAGLDATMQIGSVVNKDRRTGQKSLFKMDDETEVFGKKDFGADAAVPRWNEKEKRQAEKESLGLYLSSHPLSAYKEKIDQLSTASSIELSELPEGDDVVIGGMIAGVTQSTTKRGDPMVKITLEDMNGSVECVAFGKDIKTYQSLLNIEEVVFVKGQIGFQNSAPSIRIKEIVRVNDALRRLTKCVTLQLDTNQYNETKLAQLRESIRKHSGTCPLFFEIMLPNQEHVYIKSSSQYSVTVTDTFLSNIRELFGRESLLMNQSEILALV